jgi:hypothetical protein
MQGISARVGEVPHLGGPQGGSIGGGLRRCAGAWVSDSQILRGRHKVGREQAQYRRRARRFCLAVRLFLRINVLPIMPAPALLGILNPYPKKMIEEIA